MVLDIANLGGDMGMKEKKQGFNSIDIHPYGDNVKPSFIPFYEVAPDLVEMENIKPPLQNRAQNI